MGRAFAIATALWLAAVSPGLAADPAPVVVLYGAALDLSPAHVRALAPGTADGRACEPERNSSLFLLECGPYRMTAVFTGAGRAWHLRKTNSDRSTPATSH